CEINKKFGVYESLCCGAEIVIDAGSTFPDCPNHPKLTTNVSSGLSQEILKLVILARFEGIHEHDAIKELTMIVGYAQSQRCCCSSSHIGWELRPVATR